MNKTILLILGVIVFVISAVSCVSGKKFTALEGSSKQFMQERDEFKTQNIALDMENKELKAKHSTLETEVVELRKKYETLESERNKALDDYNRVSAKYAELQNAQEELIRGNVKETQKLLGELNEAQTNLQKKEDLLRQLSLSLDTKKASLDELTFELEKRNQRLVELEKILDAQKRIVHPLHKTGARHGFPDHR